MFLSSKNQRIGRNHSITSKPSFSSPLLLQTLHLHRRSHVHSLFPLPPPPPSFSSSSSSSASKRARTDPAPPLSSFPPWIGRQLDQLGKRRRRNRASIRRKRGTGRGGWVWGEEAATSVDLLDNCMVDSMFFPSPSLTFRLICLAFCDF